MPKLETVVDEIQYLKELNLETIEMLKLANHYLKNKFTATEILQKRIKELILKAERKIK